MNITGEFEVSLQPQKTYSTGNDGIKLGRMSIDKTFKGDLSAVSQGEMLSAITTTEGSAGYVAIEQVVGSLMGKSGSFVLQHSGIRDKGQDSLVLEVVPDSGARELVGLSGSMKIIIKDGKHFYDFTFSF